MPDPVILSNTLSTTTAIEDLLPTLSIFSFNPITFLYLPQISLLFFIVQNNGCLLKFRIIFCFVFGISFSQLTSFIKITKLRRSFKFTYKRLSFQEMTLIRKRFNNCTRMDFLSFVLLKILNLFLFLPQRMRRYM